MAAHFTHAAALDRSALRTAAGWQTHIEATRYIRAALPPGLTWDQLRVHAAGTQLLAPATGPGWVAVGDAAICWDPISAHGLTLALRTGIDGAHALLGDMLGDTDAPAAYSERLENATRQFTADVQRLRAVERRWPTSDYWKGRLPPLAKLGTPAQP